MLINIGKRNVHEGGSVVDEWGWKSGQLDPVKFDNIVQGKRVYIPFAKSRVPRW